MDWETLFEANVEDVIRISWRILGRRADVEDCVQDTFLKAFQLQQRERVRNLPGLLRRISVTTALACLRKRQSDVSVETVEPKSREEYPHETLMRREMEDRLREAVSSLPEREATVFCLRYFDGMSASEVSDVLAIPAGTVAVALHRARRKLENELADLLNQNYPTRLQSHD